MKKSFNPKTIKTIAVFVEKELLGEGLLKLPFLQALREQFPHAHISWIVGIEKSVYTSTLKPLIKDILNNVLENIFSSKMSWKTLFLKKDLPNCSFDMIINTENNLKKTLILKRLPHKHFICSLHNFLYSTLKPVRPSKPVHLTEKLLKLVEVAAQKLLTEKPSHTKLPKKFLDEVTPLFKKNSTYIGLSPGAGDQRKCWPLENFIEIALQQSKQGNIPVFILGPQEQSLFPDLKKKLPDALFPLQENVKLLESPLYTIALAHCLDVAISNDSGTGHLLAAGNIPLISLFGHTRAEKVHPFSPSIHCIKSQDLGSKNVKDIPCDLVAKKLDQILANL